MREQLHHYIDHLPEDSLNQVADFVLFLMARQQMSNTYTDWTDAEWQEFGLAQFLAETDEVEYTLDDAVEVF
jgi:hypothetical protein